MGLPPDIDAETFAIEDGAETLDEICLTMFGRSEGLDDQFNGAANQFTDLVAWDISSASAKELESWRNAGGALTHGAAVLRLWAEDIKAYRLIRAELHQRWETAKTIAQSRVDSPVVSASTSGRSGGLAEGLWDGATSTRAGRESEERAVLIGLACELALEHDTAWEVLMDQAEQVKKDLREGSSEETLERLVAAGHLGWNQIGFLPSGEIPLEEITENTPPGAVNTWWGSLSGSEQEAAMAEHADILRDLDGIPAVVRDQLNREHLGSEIERLEQEVDEAQEDRDEEMDAMTDGGSGGSAYGAQGDLEALREELATLTSLHEELEDESADRYLLALDTNDNGRAIVANGNPDTADNVATVVPGTTTTWQSVNGQMERADNLRQAAEDADSDAEHSVITWIGYDAPNVAEAALPGRAEGAVDELSGFQEGLRATHENSSPSHNTVVGHSYGSTVVGHTAQSEVGLDVDELVLVGSPGANADHVDELGFAPEDVHVSTAENDGITGLTGLTHGMDPTDPEFGATEFGSVEGSNGGPWPLGAAHSEYFDPDKPSSRYMGQVIAGQH